MIDLEGSNFLPKISVMQSNPSSSPPMITTSSSSSSLSISSKMKIGKKLNKILGMKQFIFEKKPSSSSLEDKKWTNLPNNHLSTHQNIQHPPLSHIIPFLSLSHLYAMKSVERKWVVG